MNELHNANYFKIGFVQLPDYKVPVIIKNNFTFCLSKSRENYINIFQDLNTKFKDFQGLSRTAKKIQDFPGLFQDVATLVDKEFLQSCSFKVAEILQTQIDEMCKAAVQNFKQGYEDEIATLKAEISQLSNSQEFICVQSDILEVKNDKLKKENATQSKELRTLSANSTKIEKKAETEDIKLDSIDQYSRRQNLEFHGVPQTSDENVVDIVVKIVKVLGVDINQNDISTAHRLPQKPNLNPRGKSEELPPPLGIIACFINRDLRNFIYHKHAAAKDIANKDFPAAGMQRLYINKNLTQSCKHLLWQMKQAARTRDYSYIWTRNGKIFVRKDENSDSVLITSESDLRNL